MSCREFMVNRGRFMENRGAPVDRRHGGGDLGRPDLEYNALLRGKELEKGESESRETVRLSPLPCWKHLPEGGLSSAGCGAQDRQPIHLTGLISAPLLDGAFVESPHFHSKREAFPLEQPHFEIN